MRVACGGGHRHTLAAADAREPLAHDEHRLERGTTLPQRLVQPPQVLAAHLLGMLDAHVGRSHVRGKMRVPLALRLAAVSVVQSTLAAQSARPPAAIRSGDMLREHRVGSRRNR